MEDTVNLSQVSLVSLIKLTDIVRASTSFYKLNISNNNIIEKINTQVVSFLERQIDQEVPELMTQEDVNKLYRLNEYILGTIRKKSSTLSQIKLDRILGTTSAPIVQETLNFLMQQFNLTITSHDPEDEKLTEELHKFLNFLATPSQEPCSSSSSLMTPADTFRPLSPPSSTFEPIEFQHPEDSNPTTSDAFINSPQEQAFPKYNPQAYHEPSSPFWGLPELEPPAQAISNEPSTLSGREVKKTAKAVKFKIQKRKKRSSAPHSPSGMPEESPWKGRLREKKDKSAFYRFGWT